MKRMFFNIAIGAVLSAALFVGIALVLILTDTPVAPFLDEDAIDFSAAIEGEYSGLPPLEPFSARDGAQLGYRLYGNPAEADQIVILVHGSGWHGMQFHALASHLAHDATRAIVIPDLRGHGSNPGRRGDVDHIGQFEDDLADLIDHISMSAQAPVILGGHSSGGGLVVRFAGGAYGSKPDGFILFAPFLKHDAPTTRPNSGGWAHPAIRRIVGLSMLNMVGISALNHLPVIAFAMPRSVIEGPYGDTATTAYSYRLNTSFAPRSDYGRDLATIDRPLLVIAGNEDEAFYATQYEPTISAWTDTGTYHVLPDANHISVLSDNRTVSIMSEWLDALRGSV